MAKIMRLIDLDPRFVRLEHVTETWTRVVGDPSTWKHGDPTEQVTSLREHHIYVDDLVEAHGIFFKCPKCYMADPKLGHGIHGILCWFTGRGVPDETKPSPGRWIPKGTCYLDLTLSNPSGKSSVKLTPPGCDAHFHVANGAVIMAP